MSARLKPEIRNLRLWRGGILLAAAVVSFTFSGCASRWEMGQVAGRITYQGQPLPEGTVMFVPETGLASAGGIRPDGTYRLFTRSPWDGTVVGKHKVCVAPPFEASSPNYPKFSGKYQSQETSGWEVEVKSGENTFDFDIPG
jgi:hypothetical protein